MNSPPASVRLGLISDTHGLLRPSVFQRFEGVLRILHAGDVGSEYVLTELEAIAPVTAVYGNTDGWELRRRLPEIARIEEAGRQLVVLHGHVPGSPTPQKLAAAHPEADIVVYGHTHQARIERIGRTLVVNPGAAGPARFRHKPSVAVLTLAEGEQVDVLEL